MQSMQRKGTLSYVDVYPQTQKWVEISMQVQLKEQTEGSDEIDDLGRAENKATHHRSPSLHNEIETIYHIYDSDCRRRCVLV